MEERLSVEMEKLVEKFKKDTNNFTDSYSAEAVPLFVYALHEDKDGKDCKNSLYGCPPDQEFIKSVTKSEVNSVLEHHVIPEGLLNKRFKPVPCPACGCTTTDLAAVSGERLRGKSINTVRAFEIELLSRLKKTYLEFMHLISLPYSETRHVKIAAITGALSRWQYLGRAPKLACEKSAEIKDLMNAYVAKVKASRVK